MIGYTNMKEYITTSKRVGVVEIGSRAIRLLVADVSKDKHLTVIATDWRETQLMTAVRLGEYVLRRKIKEVESIVNDFLKRCHALEAYDIKVFGTKAMRTMPSKYVDDIRSRIRDIEILDAKSEAFYSLVAAIKGLPAVVSLGDVLVIDQGAGSTELILGRLSGKKVKLIQYKSYGLGTQVIVELFKDTKGNIRRFRDMLEHKINRYKLMIVPQTSPTVVLGSPATKLAWIKVNGTRHGRYSPSKVHGELIATQVVDNLVKVAINSADQLRQIVEPDDSRNDEFETILTGLITLSILLHKLGKTEFVVSGWGTRYGIACMLAESF